MNITKETTGELTATIRIYIEKEDYREKVEKTLKDYQKKANIPGFRAGKVPFGMVKKMVGNSVTADEINKLLSDSLFNFIEENKLETLGNPLPSDDKNKHIDWDNQENFEFFFDIGLAPDISLNLSEIQGISLYTIRFSEEDIDKNIDNIRKRYGNIEKLDTADEATLILAELTELDAESNLLEGGISQNSYIYFENIKDEELKNKLKELKTNEVTQVHLSGLLGDAHEIAEKLKITPEKAEEITNQFQLKVLEFSKIVPANLDNVLFDKLYGKDVIADEQEFRDRIKEDNEKNFAIQTDKKYFNDVVSYLIDNTEVNLPDNFLKRWLHHINEGKYTKEQIEKDYDIYGKSLKWQLIEKKIISENNIIVTEQDAKDFIINNFIKPYGVKNESEPENETTLNEIAQNVLKDKKESDKIYERIYNERMVELFKNTIISSKNEVSLNEFIKLATEKDK